MYSGFLQLEVGKKHGRTIVKNSFFDGIFKITRPIYLEKDLPLLTLIHVGGGYVDGDTYKSEITVREHSRLALTTQASTKIYKSPKFGVTQIAEYNLQNNSELYVRQDSLIPYKDANFIQETNVFMTPTSTFYYTDIITPGWSEDGKLFQYNKVQSKMKIFVDGSLKVFDHLLLQPNELFNGLMYFENFSHIGTMFFINPKINDGLIDDLRAILSDYSKIARIGISLLSINGMAVRVLANSTTIIEKIFSDTENFVMNYVSKIGKIEWRKG